MSSTPSEEILLQRARNREAVLEMLDMEAEAATSSHDSSVLPLYLVVKPALSPILEYRF